MRNLFVIACVLYAGTAHGAIAFDSQNTASDSDGNVTMSYNVTVVSAINNICVVGVAWARTTVGAVSSVTIGGSAATFIVGRTATTYNTERVELWYRKGVATGSQNVAITLDGTSADVITSGTRCYTGVNQTTPVGAGATNDGATNPVTVTVSSAVGELVIDHVLLQGGSNTLTVGGGQTERYNFEDPVYNERKAGSDEAGAASVTMSWTAATEDSWAIAAVQLKPAGAAVRRSRPIVIQ